MLKTGLLIWIWCCLLLFANAASGHPEMHPQPRPAQYWFPAFFFKSFRTMPTNKHILLLGERISFNEAYKSLIIGEGVLHGTFQKLHLACGSESFILRSPLYCLGDNVTITCSSARARAPMGQGSLLSYNWLMCWPEEFQGLNHRCAPLAQHCDNPDACGDGSEEAGCSSDPFPDLTPAPVPTSPCNHTLGDFYGVFSFPRYSPLASVSHPPSCLWLLEPHDGGHLAVRFTALDLAYGDAAHEDDCAGPPGPPRHYLPWDGPCGLGASLGAREGLGDSWGCADGSIEENCLSCPPGHRWCGHSSASTPVATACYLPAECCNYQTFCTDGADERRCQHCQHGKFQCWVKKCVYEMWVLDCSYALPRKVMTAAAIGSLVRSLLMVIATEPPRSPSFLTISLTQQMRKPSFTNYTAEGLQGAVCLGASLPTGTRAPFINSLYPQSPVPCHRLRFCVHLAPQPPSHPAAPSLHESQPACQMALGAGGHRPPGGSGTGPQEYLLWGVSLDLPPGCPLLWSDWYWLAVFWALGSLVAKGPTSSTNE
ncbi:unnamed protein product [Nyctereutes procyonoides]|uniref:(raccoon dog) hypothetical protein n=1 Tax=Nyctereutes procyonoides TaxID=34880 RepID=A0A811ZXG1_NYCPR|nr:unnamed protein product [Nyctereutes procyonoides]